MKPRRRKIKPTGRYSLMPGYTPSHCPFFNCNFCALSCTGLGGLQRHLITKHSTVAIECHFCGDMDVNLVLMQSQRLNALYCRVCSGLVSVTKCTECDSIVESPARLKTHFDHNYTRNNMPIDCKC